MVSAVLALCVLGGVAGGVAAQAPSVAGQTFPLATTPTTPVTIAMTSSIDSQLAASNAADTTVSLDAQPGLGLMGGAAAGQIPAAAQVSGAATVVAAPAKLSIAVPAPAAPTPIALPAIAGTPRQMAYAVAVRAGLSAQQWSCLSQLWQQESKFQTTARNGRSGAYGIPQALPASRMASAGADWRTNPVTQIRWGLSYISTRYGTACTAWSHWKRDRWY
jgi:Transglycosylase SLT domain